MIEVVSQRGLNVEPTGETTNFNAQKNFILRDNFFDQIILHQNFVYLNILRQKLLLFPAIFFEFISETGKFHIKLLHMSRALSGVEVKHIKIPRIYMQNIPRYVPCDEHQAPLVIHSKQVSNYVAHLSLN